MVLWNMEFIKSVFIHQQNRTDGQSATGLNDEKVNNSTFNLEKKLHLSYFVTYKIN